MTRLPRIADLTGTSAGWGFFLCTQKQLRSGRGGQFLALLLDDLSGQIGAKIFQDVDRFAPEFEAGEFVKVQGRGNRFNGRLELIVESIRRVHPEQDRAEGFREEDCIPCAPRGIDEMWAELQGRLAAVRDPRIRELLERVAAEHEARLRVWPAAMLVHHAYRGGLLEHILKVMEVGLALAAAYDADADLLVAGALLHDIGKLEELAYDTVVRYTLEGNLVGHIALGTILAREAMAQIDGFPDDLRVRIEHLILSHHGAKELGSPVEPMMLEAFLLAAADDLDAKVHQVRRHVAEGEGGEEGFTAFHPRLRRVLLRPVDR